VQTVVSDSFTAENDLLRRLGGHGSDTDGGKRKRENCNGHKAKNLAAGSCLGEIHDLFLSMQPK
jgi:hypothetical protein